MFIPGKNIDSLSEEEYINGFDLREIFLNHSHELNNKYSELAEIYSSKYPHMSFSGYTYDFWFNFHNALRIHVIVKYLFNN